MKKILKISICTALISMTMLSCKAIAKAAAKHWTKKQIKEFVANCEEKSSVLMGEEKAAKYCDCAVDKVAEKYPKFEDYKKIGIVEALKIAKDCK